MTYLVDHCNHWIHFHLIEELLNSGYKVEGLMNEETDDHLLLFFGRNSNFSIAENHETKQYQTAISLHKPLEGVKTTEKLVINPINNQDRRDGVNYIHAPLLFGEWMPMNKKGMYVKEKFIPFDSEYFLTKSIYIKNFTKIFVQWMQDENKNRELEIVSKKDKTERVKLESLLYLRDNGPIEKQLNHVLEHYKMYRKIYERQ